MRRRGNVRKLLCRPYLFTGSQESDTQSKSCDSGTALEKPRARKAPAEQLKKRLVLFAPPVVSIWLVGD
jgi:hypothetical protein